MVNVHICGQILLKSMKIEKSNLWKMTKINQIGEKAKIAKKAKITKEDLQN